MVEREYSGHFETTGENKGMNSEPVKLDPPGMLDVMIKNENGQPQASRFTVDTVSLPDPDRNDGYLWTELEGVMVVWYRQDVILEWEIHR